ncbi:MAG: 50S ribosomal protein L9 [Patescibacteria group bacterium]|jgi:large subunit ribosomal protein L9
MKVILKKDIPNVGQAGQVKEVSEGYARNYLFPRQLAAVATPEAIKRAERQQSQRMVTDQKRHQQDKEAIGQLNNAVLEFHEPATNEGHLFASVKASTIIESIHRRFGLRLDETAVKLEQPIKRTGRHTVTIKHGGQTAQCIIDIQTKS